MRGLIFDIQGYAVHDGSGCRTLVFLSGCPLRCTWCANPEGQLLRPRVMYREKKCDHNHYRCIKACPYDGVWYNKAADKIVRCDLCGGDPKCVTWCPPQVLKYVTGTGGNER